MRAFTVLCAGALVVPLAFLAWLVGRAAIDAVPTQMMIMPSLMGSVYLLLLTAAIALPVALSTAVYLHEYAAPSWWKRLFELNIDNLAAVPPIVYGLLGVVVFVGSLGRSLLTGALTLTMLLLPTLVIVARESLRAVPNDLREAALALGSTRLQMVRRVVLPLALPNMLTGVIVALARGLGEAAPLIAVGAMSFVSFAPTSLLGPFSAMPLQVFSWMARPEPSYQQAAAGAILLLLVLMILMNGLALWVRFRLQRRSP